MAFTYSNDPGASDRDFVRFRLSDTEAMGALFDDAEIDFALSEATAPLHAAASLAEVAAARFSRRIGVTVGRVQVDYAARAAAMMTLAARLRAEAQGQAPGAMLAPLIAPVVTGTTVAEQNSARLDAARRPLLSDDVLLPNWQEPVP